MLLSGLKTNWVRSDQTKCLLCSPPLMFSSSVLHDLRGKSSFFNIFQLSHANELPPKLNEFSSLNFSLGLHPKLSSAAAAYENRSENTFRRCLFLELAVPHRCLPVGATMLTNFNPCSAAILQLGHIQGGYGLYI